jgi:hypothetical protein
MDGQPIDLLNIYGRQPHKRWRHDGIGPWDIQEVRVGELPDGRWYVEHVGAVTRPSLAFPDRTLALVGAAEAMSERPTGWVEVPADVSPGVRYGRLET